MLFALVQFLFSFSFSFSIASAEPWLSSRFAQNCASCHAPGRVNVEAKERRCTLSCQGCHTSPQGGGLRNAYGKWNQERWLNSMYFKGYKLNKPRPAPTKDQLYTDENLAKLPADKLKKAANQGFRLKDATTYLPESEYDRHSTLEKYVETNWDKVLARIPDGDPYRVRRDTYFNAGMDMRHFYMDFKRDDSTTKSFFPMATDLSASVEPVHSLTAVVEARFLNSPSGEAWDRAYTTASQVRSAYAMVDDLPYNTYAMYGLYRPMFGHYSPDHTSLFARATGLNQQSVFKAGSIGTAPNVPFLNVHFIEPMNNTAFSQDRGYAANLGARFVTLGAYGVLSYWDTKADSSGTVTKKQMVSATGGMTWEKLTGVFDFTQVTKDTQGVRKDKGLVSTFELRYRTWRENYLKATYETLNTSRALQEGSTKSYTLGLNSFLISSVELEMSYRNVDEKTSTATIKEKISLGQIHLYF